MLPWRRRDCGGHSITLILGPVNTPMPQGVRRIDVETAEQMRDAVMREFPAHDVLIMSAAVADYRPRQFQPGKIDRGGPLMIEFEATEDIVAAASRTKRKDQRTIGFSLEAGGNIDRAKQKMHRKGLDLIVYNPTDTMGSETIQSVLLYPDGRGEQLPSRGKNEFADILMQRVAALFA